VRSYDWLVLVASLVFIVLYGVWKGRGNRDLDGYILGDRSMRWYTVAFSIMATQASAITFISTPGQAYVDGMRFVQFYFGLPLAMVVLSITAVPLYRRLKVYTAYEYLEHRFDVKVRSLAAILFLVQRGLACGLTIYAPAVSFRCSWAGTSTSPTWSPASWSSSIPPRAAPRPSPTPTSGRWSSSWAASLPPSRSRWHCSLIASPSPKRSTWRAAWAD